MFLAEFWEKSTSSLERTRLVLFLAMVNGAHDVAARGLEGEFAAGPVSTFHAQHLNIKALIRADGHTLVP